MVFCRSYGFMISDAISLGLLLSVVRERTVCFRYW